jgi:phosphatidylinositol alpha-1,6-mannosyltransferase
VSASVAIGAATVVAGNGGIARVARISAAALAGAGCAVRLQAYLDRSPVAIAGLRSGAAGGSKLTFAIRCHAEVLRSAWALYDSVGIARAHPRLPGLRRPYAVWMHGIEAWESLGPAGLSAYREASLVLVNSAYTLARFEQLHGSLPNARVCWLATEDEPDVWQRHALDTIQRPPNVLILGRIEATESYKGHASLVDAWPAVAAAVPGARLMIAGSGSGLENLRARVAASPAAATIDILGFVAEPDMPALWRRTRVFAMPSRGEGFGLVYIEAMRWRIPVIASVHDAGQEVAIDGETGYAVSLDRPAELTDRLIRVLRDPALARAMGEAGRRRWEEYFHYSAFTRRFLPLVARL